MSGLEVAALVAGIISAYTGAATLYRKWRSDRQARRQQLQNERLDQSLVQGRADVQARYDNDFRRLGAIFARGDGTSPLHCRCPSS